MMSWSVKRIQEDDYGCEERPENEKAKVLVTLVNENGQERILRVEDDWLYQRGIDEGDLFPSEVVPTSCFCDENRRISGNRDLSGCEESDFLLRK